MFKTAKAIDAPAPKAKGKQKVELPVRGVEHYAMIDALSKALEAAAATIGADVRGFAAGYFGQEIAAKGAKPESFNATDGAASANIQLKKRASNQPLSPDAIALLRQHGIEPAREVTTPKLFGINPVYAEDSALLDRVTAALAGIVPEDFIVLQEERFKYTVTDDMLAKACSARAPAEVIGCMTSLSIKPTMKQVSMERIFEFVRTLLTAPAVAEAANAEEAAPVAARAA